MPSLAIVGTGIAGLGCARFLHRHHEITVFEQEDRIGGHTHTVDITLSTSKGPVTHGVDTGFLVFNERTYPNLINLFAELQVETAPSDMSFSVKVPGAVNGKTLEWSGTDLNSVFAQRSNLINPRFWRMLADVMRFNALCTRIAKEQRTVGIDMSLLEFPSVAAGAAVVVAALFALASVAGAAGTSAGADGVVND